MEDQRKRELVRDWRETADRYVRYGRALRLLGDNAMAVDAEQAAVDALYAADLLELSIAPTDERKGEVCPARS